METGSKSELPNSEEIFVFSGLLLDQNEPNFNQPRGNQIQDTNVKSPMLQTSIFTEYEYSNQTKCCNLCGKIFVTIEAFENHMISAHNETEKQIQKNDETNEDIKNEYEEKIDPLNISQVKATAETTDIIENVTKIVDYGKNICKICNKKFKNENMLNFHISRVHEGKKYKCHQCNKICQSSSSLNDHVNQVHENELQKCNECNKIFKSVFFKQHNCIKTDTGITEITKSDDKSLITKLSDALEISTEVVDEKDKHIPLQILNKLDGKKCKVCKL